MTRILPAVYASNDWPHRNGYRTTKIIPKPYGFIIHRFSNYISLQNIKVVYNENGFAKATIKARTNYQSPYQYTLYFDNEGTLIDSGYDTRSEREYWLKLQKENEQDSGN